MPPRATHFLSQGFPHVLLMVSSFAPRSRAGSLAGQGTRGANSWSISQAAWAGTCWWLRDPQQGGVPVAVDQMLLLLSLQGDGRKRSGTLPGEAVAGTQDLGVLAPTGQNGSFSSARHFREKRRWPQAGTKPSTCSHLPFSYSERSHFPSPEDRPRRCAWVGEARAGA